MKHFRLFLPLLISLPLLGKNTSPGIEQLKFLIGCWKKESQGRKTFENWKKINAMNLLGHGKEVIKNKVVFWEKIKITKLKDKIFYQPFPMGNQSATFEYKDKSNSKTKIAYFSNFSHDFPQQISYSMKKNLPTFLMIELKGVESGRPKKIKYILKKAKCL